MVLGIVRPEMAMGFGSKEVKLMLDEGAIHGQPTYCYGTVKKVRIDGWTEKLFMCFADMLLLELNGLKCV